MAKKNPNEMTVKKAMEDFRYAYQNKRKFLQAADSDFEFALGAQWDDDDIKELEDKGVLPLTINEIKPILRLMKGTESQNRTDAKAFPEGAEDSIKAEIATRLLKNAMKMDEGNYKISEMFTDGNICGEGWLEPYLNWDNSLLTADFGLKKSDYCTFFWDPNSREYDLSDAQYVDKVTFDLTKDQIISIYPEAEDMLDGTQGGKLTLLDGDVMRADKTGSDRQVLDYGKESNTGLLARPDVPLYDLLEHYYKKYVNKFYVVDGRLGKIVEAEDEAQADEYVTKFNASDPEGKTTCKKVKRRVPEIWVMAMVGGVEEEIVDQQAWSWPRWKGWPFMAYFAERWTARLKQNKRHLAIQGLVRDLKGLNQEKNKRRTQELRHLNQSANSGWLTPENAWVDRAAVEEAGAAPGVNLEYKPDIGKPERIFPTPLSQGHAQLANENSEDIKKASGLNADLLAMQDAGADSGRAIALRQKQGLVMVQGFFDNLSRTKKTLAKFILSQLPEIYTVERAMRVCGEAFLKDNFTVPVMMPAVDPKTGQPVGNPATGQPMMIPQVDPMTGQPQTQVDMQAAQAAFSDVLNDPDLAMYDVAVGENISQDTIQYANTMMLMDMASKGIPIPPETIIEESNLTTAQKAKIKSAIERASAAATAAPAKKPAA